MDSRRRKTRVGARGRETHNLVGWGQPGDLTVLACQSCQTVSDTILPTRVAGCVGIATRRVPVSCLSRLRAVAPLAIPLGPLICNVFAGGCTPSGSLVRSASTPR